MRFKLSTLFIFTALIAVMIVALLNSNMFVLASVKTIVGVFLIFSILQVVYAIPKKRDFWIGVAICGWLSFSTYTLTPKDKFPDLTFTNYTLNQIQNIYYQGSMTAYLHNRRFLSDNAYAQIGNHFSIFVFAIAGGYVAKFLARRKAKLIAAEESKINT